jgi:hypothetical protein
MEKAAMAPPTSSRSTMIKPALPDRRDGTMELLKEKLRILSNPGS